MKVKFDQSSRYLSDISQTLSRYQLPSTMSTNSSTNQPTKSYSDIVRSNSGRREIRVDGSEVILRDPELPESNGNELGGGVKVKSLLLANSSYGEDKNLCFVNSAINILRIVPDFR